MTQKSTTKPKAPAQAEEDTDPTVETIKVKVNEGKTSGSFVHPISRALIMRGEKAVEVPNDDWTDQMIRNKYLTEAK